MGDISMTGLGLRRFKCSWIVQVVGDLVDLLRLDQIADRLTDLFQIDHRIMSMTPTENVSANACLPSVRRI